MFFYKCLKNNQLLVWKKRKIKIPNLEKFLFRIVLRNKPFVTELESLETKKKIRKG